MHRSTLPMFLASMLMSTAAHAPAGRRLQSATRDLCLPDAAKNLADQLQDWNQLGRYHAANEELKKQPADPKRVVFMGDSITDIWKLAEAFPGKPYVNRGISGQTTPQMLVRMYPDVIALAPAAVVIFAGTNDIARNNRTADARDDRAEFHGHDRARAGARHQGHPVLRHADQRQSDARNATGRASRWPAPSEADRTASPQPTSSR